MVLTLTSTLALFVLIALSTVVYFASKRLKMPYTVLLVLVGLLLVPIVSLPSSSWGADDMDTPGNKHRDAGRSTAAALRR